MAQQAMVQFFLDEEVKKKMDRACADKGLSMEEVFVLFAEKTAREGRIPLEVVPGPFPFYSEKNMEHLRRGIAALNAGKGIARDLLESGDEEDPDPGQK